MNILAGGRRQLSEADQTLLGRSVCAAILMVLSFALSVALTPSRKLAEHASQINIEVAIPKQFGEWSLDPTIIPIMPSPDQSRALSETYDQVISYTYVNRSHERVMLSVAYGSSQKQGLRAHRQEFCYRAQGFQISDLRSVNFPVLRGRTVDAYQFVARNRNRVEPITYWFTMGDHVVRSYWERQVVQLQYALSGYIPDGYLFRVSSLGRDIGAAADLHRRFTEDLMLAVPVVLRERLIGKG